MLDSVASKQHPEFVRTCSLLASVDGRSGLRWTVLPRKPMDVILHTNDLERWTIPFLKDSCRMREQSSAKVCGNAELTVLRAVHKMNEVFHHGLRHRKGLPLCRPFRACDSPDFRDDPGRCPGLICFGPFGAFQPLLTYFTSNELHR